MEMETLTRETVEIESVDLDKKLRRDAREQLGYEPGQGSKAHLSLLRALRVLDVRPFVRRDVDRYQRGKTRTLRDWLIQGAGVAGLASTPMVALAWLGVLSWTGSPPGPWLIAAAPGLILFAVIGGATNYTPSRRWSAIPLSVYADAIPEFAVQTALDIKEICPEAEFLVEGLYEQEGRLDPFLIVSAGEHRYYIEVWNEPGFKQERVV